MVLSGELADIGVLPAKPLAKTKTESFVLVSPSTLSILNDLFDTSVKVDLRKSGSTAASVVINANMVAMLG